MKKLLLLIAAFAISFQANAQDEREMVNLSPKFRIALGGGYSRRLAKTANNVPAQFKNYASQLKNGYNLDAQASYFFNNKWSIGVKYNTFGASNSIANVSSQNANGNQRTGSIADDIKIDFIGLSTASRYISVSGKHILLFTAAFGYMGYKNDAVVFDKFQITGSTFGSAVDIGYDYQIVKNIYLGAQASFIGGVLNTQTSNINGTETTVKLPDDQKEGLSRLDLSAGIRFNF